MLAQTVGITEIIVVLVYMFIVGYLGYLGYRNTKTAADYMVAGRQVHPFVMALSYGATFISTSAIVGFGGVAGMFGMSLLWLTFLNIFVGVFIAFVFLGGPTRRMGHHLKAHTFPELLGKRYESSFIQIFSGLVIFIFIPLYAAAVLIGGCEFIATKFGISYDVALLVFSVIIAAYVIMGGLKGVMYTDALQGSIMFIGMIILLVWSYSAVGGVTNGHTELGEIGKMPSLFGKIGFKGWTSMPEFGWGADAKGNPEAYNLWWIIVSTITLGVGIGVLAQPQLAVRFMTVKSKKELNRAVLIGGIFILIMTGVAFTVGSLSNLFFMKHEVVKGKIVSTTKMAMVVAKQERGINPKNGKDEVPVPCNLIHIDTNNDGDADVNLVARGLDIIKVLDETSGIAGGVKPPGHGIVDIEGVVKVIPLVATAVITDPSTGEKISFATIHDNLASYRDLELEIKPHCSAYIRALVKRGETWFFNTGSIIPTYITAAMPGWFGLLFLLTLLAAAMSTLSSQFHALGTSIGHDVYGKATGNTSQSISITRIGIVVGIIIAVIISHYARGGYIIARATAIFFGLCGAAFLPAFVGGLFFKGVTRAGAKWSIITGSVVSMFWLVFVKDKEARALGICYKLFGKYSMFMGGKMDEAPFGNEQLSTLAVVDPVIIALPISLLVLILVSLATQRPNDEHLKSCFGK
ncbi:MAG: sodium:solute symporter family protein [Phycisphaerae bacterium]|nr:sodium:solute symporter family protein [Phycisphaerae bacterium]